MSNNDCVYCINTITTQISKKNVRKAVLIQLIKGQLE